jgi:HYR domain
MPAALKLHLNCPRFPIECESIVASDACTAASAADPGASRFALGTTPVTFTGADQSGNQASCVTSVTVQDTTPPDITCPAPIQTECVALSLAFVRPAAATSSDVCTAVTVAGPRTGLYPLGTTPLTYTATDQIGNQASCHTAIEVVDTRPAAVFVNRTPVLANADHQYRTVSLDDCGISVLDACGGALGPSTHQPVITCVTSDEPDNAAGSGDGSTTNDIVLVDDTRVKLRAERDGGRDGRTYKIHFRVQDRAGNPSEGTCTVLVPHDRDCDSRSSDRCRVGDSGVASSACAR